MAKSKTTYRPSVPVDIKRQLYRESGDKCANPGCPNRLMELHHIHEWHVYQTHDSEHMIAICPTCHHYAHHGEMKIDETTLRSWKTISRNQSNIGHLYIEPGPPPRVLIGCMYWARKDGDGAVIFRLSASNQLSFRVIPGNILIASLAISDPMGNSVVILQENHLEHANRDGVKLESRPGRLRVTVPATEEYVHRSMIDAYEASEPPASLIKEERLTLVDLQVIDIGTVQVEGIWIEGERAVIANADYLSICSDNGCFLHLRGYGETRGDKDLSNLPTFLFDGPLETSVLSAAINNPEF